MLAAVATNVACGGPPGGAGSMTLSRLPLPGHGATVVDELRLTAGVCLQELSHHTERR